MAQNRNRCWNIVINADTLPKDAKIIEKLTELKVKRYAFIHHNRDTSKREHIHLVIEFENARTFESLQKKTETWHIEPCKSLVACIQYLSHKNDQSKEQYKTDEIISNDVEWLKRNYELEIDYINDERQLIQEIINGKYLSYFDLILSNDYSLEWLNKRRAIILDIFNALGTGWTKK